MQLAGLSVLWLAVMFIPLERAFPMRAEQRWWRRGSVADVGFFLGQYLLFGALVNLWLIWFGGKLWAAEPVRALHALVAQWPLWVKLVAALALGDLCAYWGHRLQHSVGFLWRFHAIHHSNEEVDWLAAHREHPLDGLYTQTVINLPTLLLGLNLEIALGVVAFRSLWAIFIHSNVKLPLGPLRYLFGAPELHRWHHAKSRDVGNYANLAPWLDLLFGTYYNPGPPPEELGVDEPMPQGYFELLVHPFKPSPEVKASSEVVSSSSNAMGQS